MREQAGLAGGPTEPWFFTCSTLGLHLDTRCSLLQGHRQRALGFGEQRKGPGLLGQSPHPAPSLDKELLKSAVAGLACCATYRLTPLSPGQ